MRIAYHQGLLSQPSLNWFQWWALCYHLSFTNRNEQERRQQFLEAILKGSTRIFRPEIYDQVFPPSPVEQALRDGLKDDEESISPDDFDSIDQFIHGLDELKSGTIMADDDGWM